WSASPPASLAFLPYGPHFPIHPGNFLPAAEPSDAVGCRGSAHLWMEHPWKYRVWLSIPLVMFLIIWILTPTVFWPMNHELYLAASGSSGRSDADVIEMARRWVTYDRLRVEMIAV